MSLLVKQKAWASSYSHLALLKAYSRVPHSMPDSRLKDPTGLEGSLYTGDTQNSHLISPGGLPRGGDVWAESHRMRRSGTDQRMRVPPCSEQPQSD